MVGLNAFPLIRKKARMPALALLSNMYRKFYSNKARKIITRQTDWPGGNRLPLFADDMIIYIENPPKSTDESLEQIREFSKADRYKIIALAANCCITNYHKTQQLITNTDYLGFCRSGI